jgi:hypothetical protein
MDGERKKPVWAWIVAVLVGLPVLYLASFGPAFWLVSRTDAENGELASACYRPIVDWLFEIGSVPSGPKPGTGSAVEFRRSGRLKKLTLWYARIGIAEGKCVVFRTKNGRAWVVRGYKR